MNGTKYVVFQEGRVTTDGEIRIKKKNEGRCYEESESNA